MSKVAILKTKPSTILADYEKLMQLADYKKHLPIEQELILKLNLSWSLYYPACSTEPWQLEGVLKTLTKDKYKIHPVENKTVVTNVWKGAKNNKWLPILKKYNLKYEPLTETEWIPFKAKYATPAIDHIFGDSFTIPKMFIGKNVLHLPTVKCVHPETEIMLMDGSLVKIKNMVEDVHKKNKVILTEENDEVAYANHDIPTLANDAKIIRTRALGFWKTPAPKKVFAMKTKTGKHVIVSEIHPFLTSSGWVSAKFLTKGDRIAIPREVKIKGRSQPLPRIKILNHNNIDIGKIKFEKGKKYSIELQKDIVKKYISGKTTTNLTKELKIHYESIRKILQKYGIIMRWRRVWIKVPKNTSTDFWRWLGYFTAEGYAKNCNGSMRFWWSNENEEIIKDYINLTKKLFDIEVKLKKEKNKCPTYYFDCNALISFFERLGFSLPLVASTKKVPQILFKCPKKEIASFLQGYLDGDGTVGNDGLHVTSKSRELIERIQLLLIRLGVISFIKEHWAIASNGKMKKKERYWKISVYSDDLVTLKRYVHFFSKNKQQNLERLTIRRKRSIKKPSNWDTIPINAAVFRKVREGLGFSQNSTRKPASVNNIENSYQLPTRRTMEHFIKLFEKSDKEKRFKKEINYFKMMASKDIAWDYITEVKKIQKDTDYLYDLSVPETENFIGNGIILHNTHGHTQFTLSMKNAFGGLITTKRHHAHKKIHEVLVDLLQIQKEIHPHLFAVADGTACGNGNGPRTMIPEIKNYILASVDQVAIDAVAAKMMGFDPMKIKFLRLAHDRSLGCADIKQIDFPGEDIKGINFNFSVGKSPVIFFDQLLRKKIKWFEPLLFHTPLFSLCIAGSYIYHDFIWYPTIGKIRINKFMKTEWGDLFKKY